MTHISSPGWRTGRLAAGAVALLAGLSLTASSASARPSDGKVTICHATAATNNPYRPITVDKDAINSGGPSDHSSHRGPVFDPNNPVAGWGDIIPDAAAGGAGAGLNWTDAGRAIYNAGACNGIAAPDPSDPDPDPSVPDPSDPDPSVPDPSDPDPDPSVPDPSDPEPRRITLCHATSSRSNPYRLITVSSASLDGGGATDHSSHQGPLFDPANPRRGWGDIIPDAASGGVGAGVNWSRTGRSIFEAGCRIVTNPTEPTDPTDPTDPTEPTDPTDPTDPTEPTDPTDPAGPINPATDPGTIIGLVWIDTDGDDRPGTSEPGLGGLTVTVTDSDDLDAVKTTTTGDDGTYDVNDLPPGTYRVVIDVPSDLTVSWDTDGGSDARITVTVEGGRTRADVATVSTSSLRGTIVEIGSGRPIADASVSCTWAGPDGTFGTADDESFSTTAASDGSFAVAGAPAGSFTCSGTDPLTGRESAPTTVQVTEGSVASVDLGIPATDSDTTSPSNADSSAPSASSAAPQLPTTGATSSAVTLVALITALIGGVLMWTSRRRQIDTGL